MFLCLDVNSPDVLGGSSQSFRYQRLLCPMHVACGRVDPADQRPPVEREEKALPLWLLVREKHLSHEVISSPVELTFILKSLCKQSFIL